MREGSKPEAETPFQAARFTRARPFPFREGERPTTHPRTVVTHPEEDPADLPLHHFAKALTGHARSPLCRSSTVSRASVRLSTQNHGAHGIDVIFKQHAFALAGFAP